MSRYKYPSMTPAEQAEQARHDEHHPGLICPYCPVNTASQRRLEQLAEKLERQSDQVWLLPLAVLLVAIPIVWAVASLVGWWRP